MLDPDLDLEADLSIDSIKRVEILGELADRLGLGAGGGADVDEPLSRSWPRQDARGIVEWIERSSIERQAAADPRSADRSGVGRPATTSAAARHRAARAPQPARTGAEAELGGSHARRRTGGTSVLVGGAPARWRTRSDGAAGTALGATAGPTPGGRRVADALVDGRACCLDAAGRPRRRRAASRSSQAAARARRRAGRSLPDRRCRVDARPGRRRARRHPDGVGRGRGRTAPSPRSRPRTRPSLATGRPRSRRDGGRRPRDPPARRAARPPAGPRSAAADARARSAASAAPGPPATAPPRPRPLGLDRDAVVLLTGGARGITARVAARARRSRAAAGSSWSAARRCPPAPEDPATAAAPDRGRAARRAHRRGGLTAPAEIERGVRPDSCRPRDARHPRRAARRSAPRSRYHARRRAGRRRRRRAGRRVHAEHGRLDGVVHGAGVIEDKLIARQDRRVVRPGLRHQGRRRPRLLDAAGALPDGPRSWCSSAASPAPSATAARPTTRPPTTPSTSSAAAGRGPDRPRADRRTGGRGRRGGQRHGDPGAEREYARAGHRAHRPRGGRRSAAARARLGRPGGACRSSPPHQAGRPRRRPAAVHARRGRHRRDGGAVPGRAGPRTASGANIVAGVDAITDVPAGALGPGVLRPPTGRRRADRSTAAAAGSSTTHASSTPPRVRHHAGSVAGHRARPAPRAAGRRRRASPTRAATTALPATGSGRRHPRPRRLPHARASPGSTSGCAPPTSSSARSASSLPDLDDGTAGRRSGPPSHDAARARTARRRRSGWCPTWPRRGSPTGSTCAAPPTRSTRPARRSLIAVDHAVRELGAGPLRRGARRRRAPLPRRHALERVHPARRALPQPSGSGRSTAAPTAC